jgi:hypothetical protein
MTGLNWRVVSAAAAMAVGLNSAGPAHAGVLAYSIVDVQGLFMGNAAAGAVTSGFTVTATSYTSSANANLDGTFVGNSVPGGAGGADVAQQCAGPGCAPWGQNDYSVPGGITGTFALSDSRIRGSLFASPPGDIKNQTRADVEITGGSHMGISTSQAGGTQSITIDVAQNLTGMQIWIATVDSMHVELTDDQPGIAHIDATLNLIVRDVTNPFAGVPVYNFQTLDLSVGVTTGDGPLDFTYDTCADPTHPATIIGGACYISSAALGFGTFALTAGHKYNFTIGHSSEADATADATTLPAPFGLASIGAGLIVFGALRRCAGRKA